MENIDKIKVSSGEDLLAFIPHIIGYWPENSVVCIGMLGKTLRATIRLDYPPGSAVDTERFSTLVAGQLSADRQADGALIAFFGSSDWNDPEHFVHQKLYDALTQALAGHGMPVRDAWYVGKEHWRSIDCNNPECCPWPGRTNTKITASFVNAELIYRGSSVAGNPRERVPELIAVRDANFSQRVADSAVMFAKNLQGHGMAENQLSATLAVWERVLARWPEPPGSSVSGFLMACLEESSVRDTVLASIASTPQQALAGATGSGCVLANITQVRVPREGDSGGQGDGKIVDIFDASDIENNAAIAYLNAILLGGSSEGEELIEAPNWRRIDLAEEVLLFLVRSMTGSKRAPVLCMLGWIQWCRGRGSWAGVYFQQSQECQPGYRLAFLLEKLLDAGCIAAWAKNQTTAWPGYRQGASTG